MPALRETTAPAVAGPPPQARRAPACDVCGAGEQALLRAAPDTGKDLARVRPGLDRATLDGATSVDRCTNCGSLHRRTVDTDALETSYRTARYDLDRATVLRTRALQSLRRDARWLRHNGVRPGSHLLEVGSYVGAFLDLAREQGAVTVGVDPNADLAAWSRQRGHRVVTSTFRDYRGPSHTFDGVWVLNCFEQLPDLDAAVEESRRLLRPGGVLVVRTPNAAFAAFVGRHGHHPAVRALADANGLLGLPFRRCLSVRGVRILLERHGFRVDRVRGHEFTNEAPLGHTDAWRRLRPVRLGAYGGASALRRELAHPWFDVVARGAARDDGLDDC